MKDQINTIREFFSLPVPHSPQDVGPYLVAKSKAADALGRLEAMAGSQEPVADINVRPSESGGTIASVFSHKLPVGSWLLYRAAPVAQQYEAGDVASAAAQGFRDGVASVAQPQEPVKPCCMNFAAGTNCFSDPRIDCPRLHPVAQQPQAEDDYKGWYCAHCQRGVDGSEVTFHEQHTVCGRVITDDLPPKQPQAEAVPTVQIVNCDTCKHSANSCDDYPCNRCGVEFGDGPFNRWEAPQQAEAVPPGWVPVPVDALHDWKGRVNTLATLSSKADRYPFAIKLKRDIADAAIAQQKGGV